MFERSRVFITLTVLEYLTRTRGTAVSAEAVCEEVQSPLPQVQAALTTLAEGLLIARLKQKTGDVTYLIPK